jgi:hypothetical protein
VIPWKLACTACCTARQSSVDEFRSGLWPKAELGSTYGIGLVLYSAPEWNADKTRVDKVRYWTAVACSGWNRRCRRSLGGGRIYERLDLVSEDSSHNILTLDALQVLSSPR